MQMLIYLVLGIIIGGMGVWLVMKKKQRDNPSPSLPSKGEGDKTINPEQVKKHKENLGQIMGHMNEKGQVTNLDIQTLLGVSDATVVRYMDELQQQGKIEQVGITGQSVYYRLK